MNSPTPPQLMLNGKPVHGERDYSRFAPLPECEVITHAPPDGCPFVVGDDVVFTNDAGLRFNERVRGFARQPHQWGRVVYVFPNNSCWWFPVEISALRAGRIAP